MSGVGESLPLKWCSGCDQKKPLTTEFWHRWKRGKDGFKSRCKVCRGLEVKTYVSNNPEKVAVYKKTYREAHAEEIAEYQRNYQAENREVIQEQRRGYREENRERLAEQKHIYYLENRERELERVKRWAEENPERRAEYFSQWYEENRLQMALYAAQYYRENQEVIKARARVYYGENADQYAVYGHARRARELNAPGEFTREEWLQKLKLFGRRCAWCAEVITGAIHRDHVIPLSKGGSNYIENIVPSCETCNLRKKDKMPEEFAALLELEGKVTPHVLTVTAA